MTTTDSPHTWAMDDAAYGALPDRSGLTGSPMVETAYRDSADPGFVFRFYVNRGDPSVTQWERYKRVLP